MDLLFISIIFFPQPAKKFSCALFCIIFLINTGIYLHASTYMDILKCVIVIVIVVVFIIIIGIVIVVIVISVLLLLLLLLTPSAP